MSFTSSCLRRSAGKAVTQAGRELVPYVDAVLQSVERLSNYGKEYAQLSGTLRVAAAETALTYQMQPILKQFRQQAPGVKLSIQCENCFRIRDEVLRGAVDLGVHYDVGGYGGSMNVRPLAEFPITLVAAPQRQNETFDFGAAEGRQPIPLITNDKNGIYQRIMERWLSRQEIVLENVIELGNTETVKSCVAGDLGIALLPASRWSRSWPTARCWRWTAISHGSVSPPSAPTTRISGSRLPWRCLWS